MMRLRKLAGLPLDTRRRKMVELLLRIEGRGRWRDEIDRRYLAGLCRLMADDGGLPEGLRADCEERGRVFLEKAGMGSAGGGEFDEVCCRWCNDIRHRLMAVTGRVALEGDRIYWDGGGGQERLVFPVDLFLEDLRSPYNVGAAFRSAEGLGAREVFMSPGCASTGHSRARRAAMGTLDRVSGRVCSWEDLPADRPLVAMETGGTPLPEFSFPEEGILAAGSEELGLSHGVLKRARREGGVVSIPMRGGKASLNVSVSLGIVLSRWTESLAVSGGGPSQSAAD